MKTVNKYGLEYAGPRRARRGALKQWLIDLVIGAVAMALLWWLFSLVHRAATCGDVMPVGAQAGKPMLRAAGFAVPEWVAFGIVGTVVLGILGRLAWGAMQEMFQIREMSEPPEHDALEVEVRRLGEEETVRKVWPKRVPRCVRGCRWECSCLDHELEWHKVYYPTSESSTQVVDPLADGDMLKREQRAIEGMPSGLTRRDAAEIARAAAAEIELCRRMVDGAMHALSVEDYGDALAGASRRLGQVRVTLRELGMTFDQGGIDRA